MDRLSPVTDPELLAQLNDDTSESNPEIQSSLKSDYGEDAPEAAVPQKPRLKPVTDPELLAQLDEEPEAAVPEEEPFSGISSDPMGDFNPVSQGIADSIVGGIRGWGVLTPEEAEAEKKERIERARQQQLWADQQRAEIEGRMGPGFIPGQTFQEDAAATSEEIAKGPAPTLSPARSATEGFIRETARGVVSLGTAPGITIDFIDWAATGDTNESGYTKALRGYSDTVSKTFPGDPTRREELLESLGSGGGSMTAMLLTGAAGRAAGVGQKALTMYSGMAASGVQGYEDAEAHEGTPWQKYKSFFLNAGLGATEAIPISRAFDRLDEVTGGKVQKILINSTVNSLEEFIQELGQGLGQNVIANWAAGYDPDRSTTEGVAQQAAVGFILGGIMGAGTTALNNPNKAVEAVPDKGASTEQEAALKSTTPPPPPGTAPMAPRAPKGDIDPAMAQAVAGQPVESPGERAVRVAKERAAAQAAAQQASVAPTAEPVTSPGNQPAASPTAEAGLEPSATVGDAPTAPPPVEPAPAANQKRKISEIIKQVPGEGYRIGPFSFDFNRRGENGPRYIRVRDNSGNNLLQGSDGAEPGVDVTDIWSAEDPNAVEPRQGNKVGIKSLEANVPSQVAPILRDWLEGKIEDDEALARIGSVEIGGGEAAPAPAPVTTDAPSAPASNDNIIERAAAAIQESGVTSPYWLGQMLGVGTNKAGAAMIQLAQNKRLLEFKNNKFRLLSPEATVRGNPDANTAQETDATIGEQQKAMVEGKRRAVFYPEGTKPAAPPAGSRRTKIEGVGVFDYLPGKTTPKEIRDAAKAGRLNELLDLGPFNKQEVAESASAGATPVAVVERTPGGTEVKAAAGTTETAPVQTQVLEETKAEPDNTVAVEDPRAVIGQRTAPVVETRKPRVLKDLSTDSIRAEQEQAEQNEIVADRIKGTLKGPKNKKVFKDEKESTGKNWTKAQRDARSRIDAEGQSIAEANPPAENERDFLDPNPGKQSVARAAIRARAEAILKGAKDAGLSIPDKVAGNTDESMNLGQGGMQLVIARDFLKALSTPYKSIGDHYTDFVSRDLRLRNGATDEVISERRTEIDDKMRRGQGGNIEQIADTRETVESDAPDNAAQSLDGRDETMSAEDQAKAEDSRTASDTAGDMGDARIVGTDDVETKVSRTAKKTIKTFDEERAAQAEPLKEVSEERAAIEARLRAAGYMREDGTFDDATPARPLDKSEIIETYTLADAIAESSAATGNAANRFILNRILQRLGQKIGKTKVVIVDALTLAEMYPGRNVDGFYDPMMGRIVFSTNFLKNGQFDANLLAHEGLHAYLADAINSDPNLKADIQELLDFVTSKGKFKGARGLMNVHEFLSEALSNPQFQNFLMSVEVTGDLAKKYDAPGKKTLWSSMVAAIAKHLGISGGKHLDALSAAIRLTERAEDARSRAVTGRGNQLSEAGTQPIFYSVVQRVVEGIKQGKAAAGQWFGMIKNAPGVKPEELDWLGLEDWLKAQDGPVTRQQVIDFLTANELQVSEVNKGDVDGVISDEHRAKTQKWIEENVSDVYDAQYAIGAEERIFQPNQNSFGLMEDVSWLKTVKLPKNLLKPYEDYIKNVNTNWQSMRLSGGKNYRELLITLPGNKAGSFAKVSHFMEDNIVAHVRFDERIGPNGEKVLFISELQSDWHQEARKKGKGSDQPRGYNLPNAKRIRYEAAEREMYATADAITKAQSEENLDYDKINSLRAKEKALIAEQAAIEREADALRNGVPDAPFKTNWDELVLKRLMRYAADRGFASIAWSSSPDQVASVEGWHPYFVEREGKYFVEHPDSDPINVTSIVNRYTTDMARNAGKLFKKFGVKAAYSEIDGGEPWTAKEYEGPVLKASELRALARNQTKDVAYQLNEFAADLEAGAVFQSAVEWNGTGDVLAAIGGKMREVQKGGEPHKVIAINVPSELANVSQPLFRERNFGDELRAAGVPDDVASELHDVLTNDLKDVDADTLAFVMEDLKTQYGTSGSNGPTADQVNGAAAKQGEEITKAAEKVEDDFVPSKNPGRRRLLNVKSNYQIGVDADDYFGQYSNPLRKVAELIERRRVRKAEILNDLGKVVDSLAEAESRYSVSAQKRAIWQNFTSLMNDATMAEVHPDRPLDQQKHLGKDTLRFKWAKAQYPELASRYRALPPDLMKLWQATRDTYTDTQNKMNLGRLTNLLKLAGHDDPALIKRFFEKKATDADKKLIGPRVAELIGETVELSKVEGPYFPLARRGDWRVQGTYKIEVPKNARKLSDNEFEFKTRDEAIAYAEKQETKPTIKQVYVDKTTGEMYGKDKDGTEVKISKNDADAEARWRVSVQNRHVEFANTQKEAEKIAAQLRADGLKVDDVMQRTNNLPGAANADVLSEQMKQLASTLESRKAFSDLSETQRTELREVLQEVSLRYLGSTRIQSHLIRRRNVEGASKDATRNAHDYVSAASGYMARLEVQPEVDAAFKEGDRRLAVLSKQGTGAAAGASELLRELKKRAQTANVEEGNGTLDLAIRRLTQLTFLRFLASPAYSFFNAMQPHLVALPALAGEYGEARASAQFAKAYYDLGGPKMIGTGVTDTVMAFGGSEGTDHLKVASAKLKNAKERAMLEELRKIGFIDADAGMMVARNLQNPDTLMGRYYDPAMGYVDNIARQAPKAVEALNRSVVALTAYRLAMQKHGKHEQAVQDAKDFVDLTQGTYSQSNQAPVFRSRGGRIALQFKKYGQMMYYNLGRQAGRMIRGMKPGDRKAGFKALAYTLAAHQIAAGTMGLPWEPAKVLLAVLNGLGFVDYDWEEFKEDVEGFYAKFVGEGAAEMITHGVSRGLGEFGFDMSSRVGLDSLLVFGSPKSYKEADVESFFWDMISGASGAMVSSVAKAVNAANDGDWEKFLNALPLKFAVDVSKAVQKGSTGDYTLPEAILKGTGVTPASQARSQTKENREFKEKRRVKDEYNELLYGYIEAGNDMAKVAKLKGRIREWNARQEKLPKDKRGKKIRIENVEKRRREELRKKEKNKSVND